MRSNTHDQIRATVERIMAENRAKFGGWQMMADEPDPAASAGRPEKPEGDKGRAGGERQVLADLAEERTKRQQLEQQVATLAPLKQQMEALSAVFGVKPDQGDDASALQAISDQVASLRRDNEVLALANAQGITDQADIDLLRTSRLEGDALIAMAVRLKPAEQGVPGAPKPDLSQGGHGDAPAPDPGPGVPRLAAAFEAELNN